MNFSWFFNMIIANYYCVVGAVASVVLPELSADALSVFGASNTFNSSWNFS